MPRDDKGEFVFEVVNFQLTKRYVLTAPESKAEQSVKEMHPRGVIQKIVSVYCPKCGYSSMFATTEQLIKCPRCAERSIKQNMLIQITE